MQMERDFFLRLVSYHRSIRSIIYVSQFKTKKSRFIGAILKEYEVVHVERLEDSDSEFLSNLKINLKVNHVALPLLFLGHRYIGGLIELQRLHESGQLASMTSFGFDDKEYDVCGDCGGYKFILSDDEKNLIPCTTCYGTGLKRPVSPSLLNSSQRKLYICLEGKDCQRRHIYMICSVEKRCLKTQQAYPPLPLITTEAVIHGYPSMGCGVYNSKIILVGGEQSLIHKRHNGCITFDMIDNSVDHKPFMPMTYGKYRPLVFQLGKRLYVCDSKYDSSRDSDYLSIEVYSPALKTRWLTMSNIFTCPSRSSGFSANYACLVFGNSCLMSVPYEKYTCQTHCNYNETLWSFHSDDASLPFTGVATFYSQDGFEDFLMIYFSEGVVRVCKFDLSSVGDSLDLFTVKSGGGEMHGYFADFGKGCFCLTAFDNSCVHVYTFVITREGTQSDPLKVTCKTLSRYTFPFDQLSTKSRKISSVVNCSVMVQNEEAKLRAEKAAAIYYKNVRKMKDDYDPLDMEGNPIFED